ncbi:hypothetical protein [Geotalea toluenoxydans]
MIKRILFIFAFIAVFLAGVLTASIFHAGSPMVVIDFVNNSGKKIESIEIIQKFGRDEKIRHQIQGLTAGTSKTFRMSAPAESSYGLIVNFADGSRIAGGEGYMEAGNKVTEVIGTTKIESRHNIGGYKP